MNWKFWKRATKDSRTFSLIAGMYGGGVSWSDRNYENFANETYLKNIIGYRCIDIIAKSVSSVSWKIFKQLADGEEQEVTDLNFTNILVRANPEESWKFLIYELISYLLIAGNSFMEKVAPISGNNSLSRLKSFNHLNPNEGLFDFKNNF